MAIKQMSSRPGAIALLLILLGNVAACTMPVTEPAGSFPGVMEVPPVDPSTLLPSLSPITLQQREAELTDRIESELDLAGLGKITNLGKPISPDLEAFRRSWAEINPAIAPFLGTWVKDWNLMPYDVMTVLPTPVAGQVCLVRYRQMETETVPFETFTTPPEFSVALVVDGQLLSQQVQTAESLIRLTPASPYVAYDVEFLGTVEADGALRLLAALAPPALAPDWDSNLIQRLNAYQCTAGLP